MIKLLNKGIYCLLVLGFTACISSKKTYQPAKKFSSEALKQDIAILRKTLEHHHASLYWFTSKDTMDAIFANTIASLTDSLNEAAFKNKVALAVSNIRCGHTSVRNSKQAIAYYKDKKLPQFPLSIKLWNDSAVVVSNIFQKNSPIKRGTPVLSINGNSIGAIRDSIFKFMVADGFAFNFKYQVASNNFPAHYRNAFGLDSQYVITYIDSIGQQKETVLKAYVPPAKEDKKDVRKDVAVVKKKAPKKSRKEKLQEFRSLQIDTALNTAFLQVNTFSKGNLYGFFRRSFKKIENENIKHVVLDLRKNGGGDVFVSSRLTQYLADKPFRIADTVAAYRRSFPYKQYVKPWLLYCLNMHLTGKRKADGRVHFSYFENHHFKPVKRKHFDGNIFIITGGYTFSAATLVTNNLKGQKNVTIVGEETGGGAYGNSAIHMPVVTLPNSGIGVRIPLFRVVINSALPEKGRGIMPDIEVLPSSQAIKYGIDNKMERVKELIREKNGVNG